MTNDKNKAAKPCAIELQGDWTTFLADAEDNPGQSVFVSLRLDVDKFRSNPRFVYALEVSMPYTPLATGLPGQTDADAMGNVTDALANAFHHDPVAVLAAINTGAGQRQWLFYTLSLNIFQRKFNEALAALPTLPLTFRAAEDPDWTLYDELADLEN